MHLVGIIAIRLPLQCTYCSEPLHAGKGKGLQILEIVYNAFAQLVICNAVSSAI